MSIMDRIFGPKPTEAPAGQTNQINSGSDPAHVIANSTLPTPGAKGSDGSIPSIPAQATGSKSPFENYVDLWQPPKEGETSGIPNSLPPFKLDPKQLDETARTLDFTSRISPEQLARAFPGSDLGAVKEILNVIGQDAWKNTFATGVQTVEGAMKYNTENLVQKTIPEMLRRQTASTLNRNSNSLFSDPATAPMMQALERQFADKYPSATPEQIRDYSADYFSKVVDQSAASRGMRLEKIPDTASTSRGTDWDTWAGNGGNA